MFIMKEYLVEYVDEQTQCVMAVKVIGIDKTDARDNFFRNFPNIMLIERMTWIPSTKQQ